MKYRLAIFDLDGTILNTLDDLTDSLNFALKENNLPCRSIEEVKSFVGNGVKKLIERAVPAGSSDEVKTIVYSDFTNRYKMHSADKTAPYKGITEFLHELRDNGCIVAVVSNKDDYAVQTLCQKYFGKLDAVYGVKTDADKKPLPTNVLKVINTFNVKKCDAVYIGDSDVDIKTAQNAGIDCISVLWGFRDRDFLLKNGAQILVHSADELKEIIM